MRQYEYGDLPADLQHVVKVDGAYHLPLGFIIGADASWSTGGPYNRFFLNTFYQDYGDRRAPRGQDTDGSALRMHWSYVLNLRASWDAKEFIDQDLQVIAQANNVTNRAYPAAVQQENLPDGSFGSVTDRMNPTSFTLGLRYRY